MRARIYARCATVNQPSIADQVRIGKERAAREGWTVTGEYADDGISASALDNRPGALTAIRDGDARQYDVLIVRDLFRLSRSMDLLKIVHRLKSFGIRIIGIEDGFDSWSPTARMHVGMLSNEENSAI